MKETSFIDKNQKKWQQFEKLNSGKADNPEEISDLYMDITDDLSYAQTFYKRRTVRVYLNQLAQSVYLGVHKQKGESLKSFISIWKTSLPLEIYRSRKNLLFALVSFLIYCVIGVFTSYMDTDFPRLVLGDSYVNMTLENIERGDPLAVYAQGSQMKMFMQITTNNVRVAFLTFFLGFFFTLGTHFILFSNGIMLGSFQYFFYTKGLLITSFLGIWLHGAFEISAIVLAGGAGITAGSGLLFPKSRTRIQALQLSTKRGLKIMLSLVPVLILAGFIESYVTRNYQALPDWSKWSIILFSFGMILFLYVIYPAIVARKHPELIDVEEVSQFQPKRNFNLEKIRSIPEVVADAFRFYRGNIHKILRVNLGLIFPVVLLIIAWQGVNHYELQQTEYWFDWAAQLEFLMGFRLLIWQDYIVLLIWTILFAISLSSITWSVSSINESFSWKSFFIYLKEKGVQIWASNRFIFVLMLIIVWVPWFLAVLICFAIPFFAFNGISSGIGNKSFSQKFKLGFKYGIKQYGRTLLVLLVFTSIVFIFVQPIAFVFSIHEGSNAEPMMPDILDKATELIKRIAKNLTDDYIIWANLFRQIVYSVFLLTVLPIIYIMLTLVFASQIEKEEANALKTAFKQFGKRNKHQEKYQSIDD